MQGEGWFGNTINGLNGWLGGSDVTKQKIYPMLTEEIPLDLNAFTLDDLKKILTNGKDKEKTLLWFAASVILEGNHTQPFLAIWEKWKTEIDAKDLRVAPKQGADANQTIFWLLAYAAAIEGNIEPFRLVLTEKIDTLALDDYNTTADDLSVIWLLAYAAAAGHPEWIDAVLAQNTIPFTLANFMKKATQKANSGEFAFWLLALAATRGWIAPFQKAWERWGNELTFENLTAIPQGMHKESLFLLIHTIAVQGYCVPLENLWQKWGDALTFSDLTNLENTPSGPVPRIFWLLAKLVSKYPQYFNHVLSKWGNNLTLEMLISMVSDDDSHASILWFLIDAAVKGNPAPFMSAWALFEKDLTLEILQSPLFQNEKGESFSFLWGLAHLAQNDFPKFFHTVCQKYNSELKAIYHIGADPSLAFKNTPSDTIQYLEVTQFVQNHYYQASQKEELTPLERKLSLEQYLGFLLELPKINIRQIREIAYLYISENQKLEYIKNTPDLIPPHYFEIMNANRHIDWYFEVFDEIKSIKILENKAKELKEECQKLGISTEDSDIWNFTAPLLYHTSSENKEALNHDNNAISFKGRMTK